MGQEHIDLWQQTAAAFDQRYQAVTEEQWGAETPCTGWTVRDLVDHAVGVQRSLGGGTIGAEIADDADWTTVRDAISSALQADGVLDGMTTSQAFGEAPKAMMFGVGTSDLLIHTWDLARAIGAEETLPAGPVTAAYTGLQKLPTEALRIEGRFGPAIECAPDADQQTQLLSFSGRQV